MSGSVSGRCLSWIQGNAVGTKGREMAGSAGSRQKRGVFIKNLKPIIKPIKRWTPFSYHHVVLSSVSVGWTLWTLSPWQPLVVTVLGMPRGGGGVKESSRW